ncbi:MAG: N-methyl-L-tryptophan oxidase [Planctomycetes bacterium]|nr:N-methyl-L-tryptophan oxidase [Planctomycetota bacterium]
MPAHDVIVVGVGTMGSAACDALARRGVSVLGLEQFGIPHSMGSHSGRTRMIRSAYREHPDYVVLVRRAADLWRDLERASGRTLLTPSGLIFIGSPKDQLLEESLQCVQQHGVRHEILSPADLRRRFPQFRLPTDRGAFIDLEAGFLRPEKCIESFTDRAFRHGGEIHTYEPVVAWKADGNGVEVQTSRGRYPAGRLVFTPGPWADRLLTDLGVKLTLTRQVQAWFRPLRPEMFGLDRFLPWTVQVDAERNIYGFPMVDDEIGVKVAEHSRVHRTTLEEVSRVPSAEDEALLRRELGQLLPDAAGPALSLQVCLYTNTPDHQFIIDLHPRWPAVVLACGFSGHGFKFAPVVGEALADLALEGRTGLPIQFLGLHRFR